MSRYSLSSRTFESRHLADGIPQFGSHDKVVDIMLAVAFVIISGDSIGTRGVRDQRLRVQHSYPSRSVEKPRMSVHLLARSRRPG